MASADAVSTTTKEQLVSLTGDFSSPFCFMFFTVMRLTRPKLTGGAPIYLEPHEPGYGALLESRLAVEGPPNETMTGVQLLLPQSFEWVTVSNLHNLCRTIYLGETFTFYLCLHNDGEGTAEQVCVKVGYWLID